MTDKAAGPRVMNEW